MTSRNNNTSVPETTNSTPAVTNSGSTQPTTNSTPTATNPTAISKSVAVVGQYQNNVAWGSVDPLNGELALYPPENSNTIEEHHSRNDPSAQLGIFGGLTITFNNGRPYQETSTGYRSVFRHQLQEGETEITKLVENNAHYNAWYLSETKTSHIGFLVDTSGSMTSIYKNVVEQGLLEFINEQKKIQHDVKFYGSTFSHELHHLFNGVDLKTETTIDNQFCSIVPSGSTAYYDAVCDMIGFINNNYTINDEVVMVVVSDGGDNSSTRHSLQSMRRMIEEKKHRGWNIVMIGTNNLNTDQLSQNYGIGRGASLSAGATRDGMQHAFRGVSAGVHRTRTGESRGIEFTETERMSSGGR